MSGQNTNRRKRKPKELAVITDCCTGCAGSPVCQTLCPVENCMQLVHDDEHTRSLHLGRPAEVHRVQAVHRAGRRVAARDEGHLPHRLAPGDAIEMTATEEVEKVYGVLEY